MFNVMMLKRPVQSCINPGMLKPRIAARCYFQTLLLISNVACNNMKNVWCVQNCVQIAHLAGILGSSVAGFCTTTPVYLLPIRWFYDHTGGSWAGNTGYTRLGSIERIHSCHSITGFTWSIPPCLESTQGHHPYHPFLRPTDGILPLCPFHPRPAPAIDRFGDMDVGCLWRGGAVGRGRGGSVPPGGEGGATKGGGCPRGENDWRVGGGFSFHRRRLLSSILDHNFNITVRVTVWNIKINV